EQARGEKVDHRTDLFSLGSVMYLLCTGKRPFVGGNVTAVLIALATEEPALVRGLNPNVPEELAALLHRLLAKNPADRPQTATEVAGHLRAILERLAAPAGAEPSALTPSTSLPIAIHPVQQVVVPMQITARPESAFAELDTEETEDDREIDAPKPARTKS